MKKKYYFIFLIFSNSIFSSNKYENLITIVIMVKNESETIVETLDPFIKASIDSYLVFDTGSNDGTQEKIKKYFDNNNIKNYFIKEEPFIDFSTSRNRALELAEEYFPQTNFLLMIDADWYMKNIESLINFCIKEKENEYNKLYNITLKDRSINFFVARLIKPKKNIRFVGRVHEIPNDTPNKNLPHEIYINYLPKESGWEKTLKRWERDKEWLLQDHLEDPKNKRTIYMLAQTYQNLGDIENAITYFKKYIKLDNISEYAFMTYYNKAGIFEEKSKNSKEEKDKKKYWLKSLNNYIKAYNLRPHRAEPLYKIALYYMNNDNMALSYIFAKRAVELEYPKNDYLFIDNNIYNFERFDILGVSAWFAKDFESGQNAVKKALEIKPDAKHLHKNLELYLNKKYDKIYNSNKVTLKIL